jgi:hypothetical protein
VDVLGGEVWVLGEDVPGSHAVGKHGQHRRDREAQPSDAGQAAHDSGVCGDAFVGHYLTLASAGIFGHASFSAAPCSFGLPGQERDGHRGLCAVIGLAAPDAGFRSRAQVVETAGRGSWHGAMSAVSIRCGHRKSVWPKTAARLTMA